MSSDPKVYLSSSEGKFRVIQGGVPISADKRTAAEALAVAEHFRLKVSDKMWDGDAGTWRSRSTVRDHRRPAKRERPSRTRRDAPASSRGGDPTVAKLDRLTKSLDSAATEWRAYLHSQYGASRGSPGHPDYYALTRDDQERLNDLLETTRWKQSPSSAAMGRSRRYGFWIALRQAFERKHGGSKRDPKAPRRAFLAARRKERKLSGRHLPKFKVGAIVEDKDPDGRRRGEVSFIGGYDDFLRGWQYKVRESDGTRKFWNEGSMRLVRSRKRLSK